ncbi:MAG: hypothetical protein IJE70_07475 [Oscillospiraceae bacterium]|nr:hypothetical protein [Oscillospiraceae bacterium]
MGSREETTAKAESPNLLNAVTHTEHTLSDITIPQESGNVKETVISANPGFTKTEFSDKITNKQIRALDSIGRALGVNISIGAPTGEKTGAYNGYYENGNIVIAQDAKNPLEVVLCHEVTHHMKNTSPAEYNAFLELAINASEKLSNTEKSELITRYKTAYSEGTQTEFSDAQALDEIAADFTKNIVNDVKMFERLAQDNRTVAMKLMNSIKDFITKVKSTFSGDRAKADTAAQEKYGARVSELEAAVAQFEKMLSVTETAVASGNINTAGTDAGGGRLYSIETNAKGKYVKADRQVIFGMDPKSWGEQVENYIYKKIMDGETVQIPTDDGDVLSLTENTVGKSSFRNFIKKENRYMNDEEYLTKLNAETHIDELAQISRRGDKVVPDFNGIHGEMAKDGWNYRIAYFEDFDGKYYRIKISTALGEDGKTVYNIDEVRERSFPTFSGSSSENRGAHSDFVQNEKTIGVKASSKKTIPQTFEKSNRENSSKTADMCCSTHALKGIYKLRHI